MIRVATRAIIMKDDKLLLVNAWKSGSDLMCAPGGGAELHSSLPDNLKREVMEETGLSVDVGDVCLVNEFHDPSGRFHQVDVYFRCTITAGEISDDWVDIDKVVTKRRWVGRSEMAQVRVKPDSLADVAWNRTDAITYDPLEPVLK